MVPGFFSFWVLQYINLEFILNKQTCKYKYRKSHSTLNLSDYHDRGFNQIFTISDQWPRNILSAQWQCKCPGRVSFWVWVGHMCSFNFDTTYPSDSCSTLDVQRCESQRYERQALGDIAHRCQYYPMAYLVCFSNDRLSARPQKKANRE